MLSTSFRLYNNIYCNKCLVNVSIYTKGIFITISVNSVILYIRKFGAVNLISLPLIK